MTVFVVVETIRSHRGPCQQSSRARAQMQRTLSAGETPHVSRAMREAIAL
jgi:hypothetical protein